MLIFQRSDDQGLQQWEGLKGIVQIKFPRYVQRSLQELVQWNLYVLHRMLQLKAKRCALNLLHLVAQVTAPQLLRLAKHLQALHLADEPGLQYLQSGIL